MPPSDPLSVTFASPPTTTTAPLVPVMSKLAAVVVPVQVSPVPQVTPPAVDTATVEAVAPLMTVANCRSLVLESVIWRRIFAFAVPVAVAACAAGGVHGKSSNSGADEGALHSNGAHKLVP